MKSGKVLVATVFALTSLPFLAQQPSPATQPSTPPTQQSPAAAPQSPATPASPAAAEPAQQAAPPASSQEAPSPAAAAGPMSPVNGELESKLDSKTAKTGDNVVVRTKSSVKTADGTEIPKGSKLMGHVIAVQPSAAGATSQMALQFDHIELKSGQSLQIHSQIQSISPAGGTEMASGPSETGSGPVGAGRTSASSAGGGSSSSMSGAQKPSGGAPQGASDAGAVPAANGLPAPGTVVAQNGNIAIQTTAVPGILIANNAPGQQDPRMAKASSILLGAKKDIQLDGGTQMVVGVSAAGAAGQ